MLDRLRTSVRTIALGTARTVPVLGRAAIYVARNIDPGLNRSGTDTYSYLRAKFIENGNRHAIDEAARRRLVQKFEAIDGAVPTGTTRTDGLFLAEMLLNMRSPGAIVECGCYAGGSSAKISLVAELLDRDFLIFDSFQGLPSSDGYNLRDMHCRRSDRWVTDWTAGRYACKLNQVKHNIETYGSIARCTFVEGWFSSESFARHLPDDVALAFVDVDVASSAKTCFVSIYPRLSDGGIFVTHDTAYIKVLLEFYDRKLWQDRFQSIPPIMFGAGFGLCNESPHIGYMVKSEVPDSAYLKSLTIDK